MLKFFLVCVSCAVLAEGLFFGKSYFKSDPDEYINTIDLIKSKGYPAEKHEIETSDGYILEVQRIPAGRKEAANGKVLSNKPAVLLQHGLLDASHSWVINFPEQSLGFILADRGFDVWLGNIRGNTYGMKHKKFNTTQDEFWDFSWDQMAANDFPAMINYVLNATNQESLFYVGHSQGTLIAFSHISQNPDLNKKIKLFVALGPVATVGHMKSPIKYIADLGIVNNQQIWYSLFGKKSFLPSSRIIDWLADRGCNDVTVDTLLCMNVLVALCGPSKYLNKTRISVYATHDPAGTSVKNLAHFAQASINKKYQMYDYGKKGNLAHYNQSTPPVYNLKNVQVPVALYWATNDWLADPNDVSYLRENLPNLVDDFVIDDWDHLDFIWAMDAKDALYERIIQLFNIHL